MKSRQRPAIASSAVLGLAASVALAQPAQAQRSIASVPTSEATMSGATLVQGPDTILRASNSQNEADEVAAGDRPAHLKLTRGGTMLVCQASAITLTSTQNLPELLKGTFDPLLVTLTKGSLEVAMPLLPGDTLVTPEMRLESSSYKANAVPLDLALHVDGNGDTCVENRAAKSSPIVITDVFGASRYTLKPGDHVLFQHGMIDSALVSDDRPCGCPPPSAGPSSLGLQTSVDGTPRPGHDPSSAAFPFPVVASQKNELPLDQAPAGAAPISQVGLQASLTYEALPVNLPSPPPVVPPAPSLASAPGLPPVVIVYAPPMQQAPAAAAPSPVATAPPLDPPIVRTVPPQRPSTLSPLNVVVPRESAALAPITVRPVAVPTPASPSPASASPALPADSRAQRPPSESRPAPVEPVRSPAGPPASVAATAPQPVIVYVPAPVPGPPPAPAPQPNKPLTLTPAPRQPREPKSKTPSAAKAKPPAKPAVKPAPAGSPAPEPLAPAPPQSPRQAQSASREPHGVIGSVSSATRAAGRSIGRLFKKLFTQ